MKIRAPNNSILTGQSFVSAHNYFICFA